MTRFPVGRLVAAGLAIVATLATAALAAAGTAQAAPLRAPAQQLTAVGDDAVGPILFYRGFDGFAFTGDVKDTGEFLTLTSVGPLDRGWTHVVGVGGGRVLFYQAGNGVAVSGTVNTSGEFADLEEIQFAAGFTHVTYAGAGRLLLYRASDGRAEIGAITSTGLFDLQQVRTLDPNWTLITYAGGGRLLFYRSDGMLAAGRVTNENGFEDLWFRLQFTPGLQQIAYAGQDHVFMYRRGTRPAAIVGRISDADLERTDSLRGFDSNWTLVTYAGARRVLFYKSSTGVTTIGEVGDNGGYRDLRSFGLNTSLSQITSPLV